MNQLVELNENLDVFAEENAVVVAAVMDPVQLSQQISNQFGIQFPIMSDVKQVGSEYGVRNVPGGMDMGPVNTHSIFIIDEEGTVQWSEISPHEMYVPLTSILEELRKL